MVTLLELLLACAFFRHKIVVITFAFQNSFFYSYDFVSQKLHTNTLNIGQMFVPMKPNMQCILRWRGYLKFSMTILIM